MPQRSGAKRVPPLQQGETHAEGEENLSLWLPDRQTAAGINWSSSKSRETYLNRKSDGKELPKDSGSYFVSRLKE